LFLLLTAIYQIVFLSRIPRYAIIAESNKIAKMLLSENQRRFIYAILNKEFSISNLPEVLIYSLPEFIYLMIKGQYPDNYIDIFKKWSEPAVLYVRKKADDEIDQELLKTSINGCYLLKREPREGEIIQDFASQRIASLLGVKRGDTVLDLCAAPGGKSFHIADLVGETGKVYANEFNRERYELLKSRGEKLGYKNIVYTHQDGLTYQGEYKYILIDAPCSGLGTIGKKPDILLSITPEQIDNLIALQTKLLTKGFSLLSRGAILIYSTCTINKNENSRLVHKLLAKFSDIRLLDEEQLTGLEYNCDGFYYARFTKD
jgi:16S rRNA (cytosine967-C5)-methyltransferase